MALLNMLLGRIGDHRNKQKNTPEGGKEKEDGTVKSQPARATLSFSLLKPAWLLSSSQTICVTHLATPFPK